MDDMGGNKQLKQLHTAITKGNEEMAVQLYASDGGTASSSSSSGSRKSQSGKMETLSHTLEVNELFKLRGLNDQTPMNLVSQFCMVKLCQIFLENGGNPNSLNSQHQSCIHSLCSRPEAPVQRDELLKIFLDWESTSMSGEQASLNQVDLEGNTAVHLAAMNGLLVCVMRLVKSGAIISLVNNSQRTCCELADVGGHADLASMLELALIFQPLDADMAAFDETNMRANSSQLPTYMLDSASKTEGEMMRYMEALIRRTAEVLQETEARTETLLKFTNWNSEEVVTACQTREGKLSLFEKSGLHCKHPSLSLDEGLPSAGPGAGVGELVSFDEASPASAHVDKVSEDQDDNNNDEEVDVMVAKVSVVDKASEGSTSLKPVAGTSDSHLKPAAGEAPERLCEICMAPMKDSVDSYEAFMSRVGARVAASSASDDGEGSLPASVQLSDEEQDLALSCESNEHSYCLSCWSQHVVAKVSDHGFDRLACPAFKCGECVSLKWAQVLLQSAANTRAGVMEVAVNGANGRCTPEKEGQSTLHSGLMHSRTRRFVDMFHASHYCPHTGCDKVVLVNLDQSRRSDLNFGSEALPQTVICSAGHASCLVCKEEGHAPCSCEEYRKWKTAVASQMQVLGDSDGKSTGAEEVATKLWFNANTKKCPRCGATIEKDEGCNHMTCGNCKHDFCWMCMRPWSEHTNATGGYFVCNRFVGDDEGAGGRVSMGVVGPDDDDVLGLSTRARGQPGSSSEEAKRQAAANQKMARFIHFFTRFNGHNDSMNKEISIRNATFSRILSNAERTANGELAWLRAESPDENIAPTPPRETPESRVITASGSSVMPPLPPDSSASSHESDSPRSKAEDGGSTNPLLSSSRAEAAEPSSSSPPKEGDMTDSRSSVNSASHTPQRPRLSSASLFSRPRSRSNSATGETPLRNASGAFFRALFRGGERNRGKSGGDSSSDGSVTAEERADATRKEQEEGYRQQYSDNTSSLLFLRDAFEELSRARLFLKGSYAYGYFKFQNANVRATKATMYARHQVLAMEKCFTDAQGELEFSAELLSDVVARKRLRASQHDIRRSALAARAKRLEMEDMLLGMEVAEATERAVQDAAHRADREERSVLLAKKRSSVTTGATAKADLRGFAALDLDRGAINRVVAGTRREHDRLRREHGRMRQAGRRTSTGRPLPEEPMEQPVGLWDGPIPPGTDNEQLDSVLRDLVSDLRAQQRTVGTGRHSADIDQFEALLQAYDVENLPMAPTSAEAQAGDISAFQRAEPATARAERRRKKKRTRTHSDSIPAASTQSGARGSAGSFSAAPASPRSTPGVNIPSTSAHSSPVRVTSGRAYHSDSSEVSGSDSSSDEEDGEDGNSAATRQQYELQRRHMERTGTSTGTSTSSTSSSRAESTPAANLLQQMAAQQEQRMRQLEGEQEEQGEGEEGDYELHQAILASLNLGPSGSGTVRTTGSAGDATASSDETPQQGQGQGQGQGEAQPSPEDIDARAATLTEMMGCSEDAARLALSQSNFSVEAALDRLLSGD